MNVYDFDKTIYKSDSTADFFLYSLKKHPKIFLLLPGIFAGWFKFYILKKGTKTQFKSKIMKFVKYIDYKKDIDTFWNKNEHKIKDFYTTQQKEDDVIISASPTFILEPVCKKLGIKHLMCSEFDRITGLYSGENCHGKEKVKRYREIFGNAQIDEFYSDSYSDTPLAEIAEKAFMVKGNKITPWLFR